MKVVVRIPEISVGGSPEAMRALGEAARRHVRSDYGVAAIRARYAEALGLRLMP